MNSELVNYDMITDWDEQLNITGRHSSEITYWTEFWIDGIKTSFTWRPCLIDPNNAKFNLKF